MTKKEIILLPCPFCGSPGEIKEAAWTGMKYARCSNKACWIRPSTYKADDLKKYGSMSPAKAKEKNIAEWNRRKYERS